jgi:hypothetical protein
MAKENDNTIDMPEVLDFLGIAQQTQVYIDDKPVWTLDGLNEAIQKAVKKAVKHSRKTEVSLKIAFRPQGMNAMEIDVALDTKEPKPTPRSMLAFTDTAGRLFGDDPAQTRLPLDKPVEFKRSK